MAETTSNHSLTNSSNSRVRQTSRILDASDDSIQIAGDYLRQGKLVAFPTETVYGLGADALNESAVLSIFAAKGRPLTDPVIVHVNDLNQANTLIDISSSLRIVYEHVARKFWPGPLTLVAKASKIVPDCITASTGYVGVRSPSHPVARKLIQASGLSIAAPSANRFGHVSPTTAQHVLYDLPDKDVIIIDGGECGVGIESTVVKIDHAVEQPNTTQFDDSSTQIEVHVLRRGGISVKMLRECLSEEAGLPADIAKRVTVIALNKTVKGTKTAQVAPGQLLTHYAPDVPAYIVSSHQQLASVAVESDGSSKQFVEIAHAVIIDFGGQLRWMESTCLAYIELSASGDVLEAAHALFDALRRAETIANAKAVLLPDLRHIIDQNVEHADALFDRIFRAASGTFVTSPPQRTSDTKQLFLL